jgi:hypothetical protein
VIIFQNLLFFQEANKIDRNPKIEVKTHQFTIINTEYIAYHIRRGDFQQTQTRLEAEDILQLTKELVPDRKRRIAYISTDEGNRSFFAPFVKAHRLFVLRCRIV